MCVVSMVGDHYKDKWEQAPYNFTTVTWPPTVTKEEFEALKREVLEMKKLLERALKYDIDNGEKDCQKDEKIELLRKVAEYVGLDLKELG